MKMTDNFAFRIATETPIYQLKKYYKDKEGCNDKEAQLKAGNLINEAVSHVHKRLDEEFKSRKRKMSG